MDVCVAGVRMMKQCGAGSRCDFGFETEYEKSIKYIFLLSCATVRSKLSYLSQRGTFCCKIDRYGVGVE